MIHRFARPVPEISMITNTVMDHIFLSHGHRISQRNFDILSPAMLQEYADVRSMLKITTWKSTKTGQFEKPCLSKYGCLIPNKTCRGMVHNLTSSYYFIVNVVIASV